MSVETEVESVSERIADLLLDIKEEYMKAYPDGDYMSLTIQKDYIMFNNAYFDRDSDFPIDYYHNFKTERSDE